MTLNRDRLTQLGRDQLGQEVLDGILEWQLDDDCLLWAVYAELLNAGISTDEVEALLQRYEVE